MSVLSKKWLIKNTDKEKTAFRKILENRGFENLDKMNDFYDPFLFEDMEKAVSRIKKAINLRELITIFGDYDVDGISGTAIIAYVLGKLNANVSCKLPHRVTDGYGLSEKIINEFIENGTKLIITVDCGISCVNEIKKAKDSGIDAIITDHHAIPALPPEAFAILHPKQKKSLYPFRELTGAGVALKLAHALIKKYFKKDEQEEYLNSLLDLAALGTVADLGSLTDENRLIVKRGLKNLANTRWAGLKRLKQLANIKEGESIDTTQIGFQIAPRINAAGRIGDPYMALNLLLEEECGEKTNSLGEKLENLNKERQQITSLALEDVEKNILNKKELPYIFIEHHPDWHVGIIGLVAGKIVEKYSRPCVIMQDFGETLVGSARSPDFFNIIEAISACSGCLDAFGGHEQAAGFDLKKINLEKFKTEISKFAENKLKNIELKPLLEIDCEILENEINFEFIDQIEKLEPFGAGNRKPAFLLKNISPQFIDRVGYDGNHLKFSTKLNGDYCQVIAFRMGEFSDILRQHKKIDLVFHLERNSWNSKNYLQLHGLDFRRSK